MSYPPQFEPSLARVAASRRARAAQVIPALDPAEKAELLRGYHPDYRSGASLPLEFGPSAGALCARELAQVIAAPSRIDPRRVRLASPDHVVDVLVLGGGGAGAIAALAAADEGASVLIATKLRMGDSNTIMATGMAASVGAEDSPVLHYLDTMGGGGFTNEPALVEAMVKDGPEIVSWLEDLGVLFDKRANGELVLGAAGGYSRPRSVSAHDYTGLEIIRVLRDELQRRRVRTLEFHAAVELLLDEHGACAGAVLEHMETGRLTVVAARSTILATGGMGRLHCHGFPTSNHYGATADGIVIGYRAGAELAFMDSVQFHPTGVVWPEQMFGWLVSERCRGMGGHLVNVNGERFFYERETRDAVASSIIRECERGLGVETPAGAKGVWLDTPVIEAIHGASARPRLQAMYHRFLRFGIDIWNEPVLIYPTQHYQNGGLRIDPDGQTTVPGLYAAGEVSGGVHGRNRLGGNSLLDVFVFGRRAGAHAGRRERGPATVRLTLDHVVLHNRRADPDAGLVSPILLPRYAAADPRANGDQVDSAALVTYGDAQATAAPGLPDGD